MPAEDRDWHGGTEGSDEGNGAGGQPRQTCGTPVLVVDDDEGIRETLRFALEESGYVVTEASNGLTALEALRTSSVPLVVLLDHVMPGFDGAKVLQEAAADAGAAERHIFLLVTASVRIGTLEAELQSLPLALGGIIHKPFDLDALLSAVADAAARLPRG